MDRFSLALTRSQAFADHLLGLFSADVEWFDDDLADAAGAAAELSFEHADAIRVLFEAGAQPKLVGRMVQGRFVEGWTDEELLTRYDACRDLAEQLIEYAKRKRVQLPELPLREFLQRLRAGVEKKRWDIYAEELSWMMQRVTAAMGGRAEDVPTPLVAIDARAFDSPLYRHVDSVIDTALGRINGQDPVKR